MRILVTGGAGFIGSQYVRTLLGGGFPAYAGATVTVLDKLHSRGDEQPRLEPLLAPVAPHDGSGRHPRDDLHDLGRPPDLCTRRRRPVEKRLLHHGMIEVQRAHRRRGRRHQVAPGHEPRAGVEVPPARRVATRVQERLPHAHAATGAPGSQ